VDDRAGNFHQTAVPFPGQITHFDCAAQLLNAPALLHSLPVGLHGWSRNLSLSPQVALPFLSPLSVYPPTFPALLFHPMTRQLACLLFSSFLCTYQVMIGCAVPGGVFIPSMIAGAAMGRVVGHFFNFVSGSVIIADNGTYALVWHFAIDSIRVVILVRGQRH